MMRWGPDLCVVVVHGAHRGTGIIRRSLPNVVDSNRVIEDDHLVRTGRVTHQALDLRYMVVPLFYLGTLEGKAVLGAFVFGALFQGAIFSSKGFVRLLGIGHIVWVPMVAWLWTRLDVAPANSLFKYWLLATIVLVSLSLLVDAVDVIRYLRGERDPYLASPV